MSPVANTDLREFLADAHGNLTVETETKLETWMSCLIGAISYIHSQLVRHKDLKPANVLIRGSDVFVTDFGISRDLFGETTTGSREEPTERTPMYCAPESNVEGLRRGRSADMFSLGCILLEMLTVLMGQSIEDFEEFRTTGNSRTYAANHQKLLRWMVVLYVSFEQESPRAFGNHRSCLHHKLATVASLVDLDPESRPMASELYGCDDFKMHGSHFDDC